jgi:hypothetical protein
MGRATISICALVLACQAEREAPGRTPPASSAAAAALAKTFAPEVVGTIVPAAPVAGDYALALTMTFEEFPTMEMRVDDRRTGAMRMTLASDGTVRACLGSHGTQSSFGQYHYEPDPAKRQHHESEDVRLLALGGTWKVVDGVGAIAFDHLAWNTCDLATATKLDKPITELRCIAIGPTARVPAGSLGCEATDQSQLLGLGMPMTAKSRVGTTGPIHSTPEGPNLVLGAPGLAVEVAQDAHASIPTITFKAGAVKLVEADYQPKPRK